MPRIDESILDIAIYLYPTEAAARSGEAVGGSGFLVGLASTQYPEYHHLHAVTNSHVVREGGSPVVRLNSAEGGTEVLPLTADDWVHHQDGDDLAVALIELVDPYRLTFACIGVELLLTKEIITREGYGPGDETYMVGRFVPHGGRQQNRPTVRFGNISAMASEKEKIRHARGIMMEAFLVETRSLGGYSGAPVFVHRPYPQVLPFKDGEQPRMRGPWIGEYLLGVDCGHMPIYESVLEKDRRTPASEEWVVKSNSGQMIVAPAWKLDELLRDKGLVDARASRDDELGSAMRKL